MAEENFFLFSLKDILGERTPVIDVLDIGAMQEGEERYAALSRSGISRVTAVEPNPPQLAKLRAARPDIHRFIPHFLGDGRPATLHVTRYPGCISLYEPDPAVIDRFTSISTAESAGNFHVLHTERIETKRLDDIDPPVEADYIKIDIQGSELDVLRHATDLLSHVLVVECEVEFIPLYKNQPLLGDVQMFLRDRGFMMHKMIDVGSRCFRPLDAGGNRYAGMSQLLWADAVFVRDFTDLAAFADEDLLKLAVILHDIYASYDLVCQLLGEDDRRTGGNAVVRYTQRLMAFPEHRRWLLNFKEWI